MSKIRIAGAGIAGGYLWRLLTKRGLNTSDIEIVDPGNKTRCGITPCGFAITRQFYPLCRDVGLDPQKYIVSIPGRSYQGNIRVRAKGYVLSIDKPAFIRDLLEGAEVLPSPSNTGIERIIDATGNARAFIGPHSSPTLWASPGSYPLKVIVLMLA
jgi:flavin-dependent dehydrogenase